MDVPLYSWKPFLGTKLLGISMEGGLGALKGLTAGVPKWSPMAAYSSGYTTVYY